MNYSSIIPCFLIATLTAAAQADQFVTQAIDAAGSKRTYHVHKPDSVTKPLPLVVVLHGGGGSGRLLKDTYGFKPFINNGEFIAIYPDAGAGGWLPEHVAFLDAAIDDVVKREKIDREQLFITGASRGGLMTLVMAAKSKHSIRAAGTVIASHLQGLADEFPIARPIDFAMIAGTADPLMPYNGGWGNMGKSKSAGDPKGRVLPVEETIGLLLKANSITDKPVISTLGDKDPNDGCTNEVRRWNNSATGRRVMLVKIEGGGHVVPGGKQYLPKSEIGPACGDFDHAEVMWEFFKSSGSKGAPAAVSPPTPMLDAAAEKLLRERVAALFDALRAGDTAKCIELSDPQVVKEKGRATAEKFFKGVSGLIRLAKVQPNDRVIKSITPLDGGKAARVEIELTLNSKKQAPGFEVWGLIDGNWYYRETK
jgi:polyhydroxybutyrate depolymerase